MVYELDKEKTIKELKSDGIDPLLAYLNVTRLKILATLSEPKSANEIAKEINLSTKEVVSNLNVLVAAGIVNSYKEDVEGYSISKYSINRDKYKEVIQRVKELDDM